MPRDAVVQIERTQCSCKTKHAVVPGQNIHLWAAALVGTPLAPALTCQTRFLGVTLCSRSRAHEAPVNSWSRAALNVCRTFTWEKAIRTCQHRCRNATAAGLSLDLRCHSWNTYCMSTLPYPAATTLPGPTEMQQLYDARDQIFPTDRTHCSSRNASNPSIRSPSTVEPVTMLPMPL